MTLSPFQRFLGVERDDDPLTLLGLDDRVHSAVQIDQAVRTRVAETFNHPDGRSDDAEMVRSALREAAEALKAQIKSRRIEQAVESGRAPNWMAQAVRSRQRPNRAPATPLNLTAFDKLVLATLVAFGGWNARSRAQLVALAQQYGVSVQGLLRVMQGLSEYARSGGPRIGVTDIAGRTGAAAPLAPVASAAPPPVGIALLDRMAENLGRELKGGGAWPTIKLAIIFAVITLIVGIIAVRAILLRTPSPQPGESSTTVAQGAGTAATRAAATSSSDAQKPGVLLARFPSPPTFLGNGLPADAVNAVDQLPNLPAQIDELGRRIAVADGEPAESVYRQWDADVNTIAMSWSIGDASVQRDIERAMFETLRAAGDTPTVSDRLLKSLIPPASLAQPTDLLRGTYMTMMLAKIAGARNLPPVVSDRARNLLEITLSHGVRGTMQPVTAADLWLSQRLPHLTQMLVLDDAAYDAWELWLAAQRALGEGERLHQAFAHALKAVLETDYDMGSPGRAVNVAARLMNLLLKSDSAVARQRVLDLFDDESVASRDLWVLTSLLTTAEAAPWYPDHLVVPEDADMAHRWRIRDDLSKAWPVPQSLADVNDQTPALPELDPMEVERWDSAVTLVLADSPGSDQTTLMQQIIDASRLIEAAANLVAQAPDEAGRLIGLVEGGWSAAPAAAAPTQRPPPGRSGSGGGGGGGQSPVRSGQPIGADGAWARQYADAGRNAEARIEIIRMLRTTAGTDLGPIDAAVLVREAYRGSPQDLRSVAQAVIEQQFSLGPNIAMQMLDQLADAPAVDSISELIQSVTGRLLPAVRTTAWKVEARLALVQHALSLRDAYGTPVDSLLEPLTESYAGRLALAKGEAGVLASASSPQEAAAILHRALLANAEFAAPFSPTPADLPTLQRRHHSRLTLAEGPIQTFVAHQLAILDVTVYLIVAEQPELADRAMEIVRDHALNRMGAMGVLEQSRDIELATMELWRLRLGLDPLMSEDPEQAEDAS